MDGILSAESRRRTETQQTCGSSPSVELVSVLLFMEAMSTARSWVGGLIIGGISLVLVPSASWGGVDPFRDFYRAKALQTSRQAFERAAEHLTAVRPGMHETDFLAVMKMEVLGRGKKPYDARMDGYLADASRRANQSAEAGHRLLIFGFIESGKEVPMVAVDLVDRRVLAVVMARPDVPAVVATALGPVGASGPEGESSH